MSFWSTEKLKARLTGLVDPPDQKRVKQGAYEMSLGREAYISGAADKIHPLPLSGPMITIEPGRVALLLTEERVRIPVDAIGFISLKSKAKFPGLINVSGFHVDPGYRGHLVFTVYNAGTEPITHQRGEQLFLLWIADMPGGDDPYPKEGISRLTSDFINQMRRPGASPADLDIRVRRLEAGVRFWSAVLGAAIAAVIASVAFAALTLSQGDDGGVPAPATPDEEQALD